MFIIRNSQQEQINYIAVPGLLNDYKVVIKTASVTEGMVNIMNIICDYTNITEEQILGKKRTREFVLARQIFFHCCRRYTATPLKLLCNFLGKKHHSTAIHGIATIKDLMETDPKIEHTVKQIENIILGIKEGQGLKYDIIKSYPHQIAS